jgi:hypothetical protein
MKYEIDSRTQRRIVELLPAVKREDRSLTWSEKRIHGFQGAVKSPFIHERQKGHPLPGELLSIQV